jgi:hypothetical protein
MTTTKIRRISLDQDKSLLVDFLFRYLTSDSDERRFDWLYLKNPSGLAQAWALEDSHTGAIVGVSAVFPRTFHVGGEDVLGFVLGDFCIHPNFRSLGPAIQLQKACLEQMDSDIRTIGYDFPSEGMLAVHRRLGAEPGKRMIRFAKPLRVDRKVAEMVKSPKVSLAARALGNQLLKWRDTGVSLSQTEIIARHEGSCQDEFSTLAAKACPNQGICVARTAEYLNWRYLAHPFQTFEILTARRCGALVAYLVLNQTGDDDARIVDLLGIEDRRLVENLVAYAVKLLRGRGVITLSAPLLTSHPSGHPFLRLGFTKRDSCPVITYHVPRVPSQVRKEREPEWFLMDGDRES